MCVVMVSEVRIRVPLDILSLVSDSFLRKYEAGSLGDDEDFVAWYGELMFLKEAEREYEKLRMVIEDIRRGLSK